MKQSIVIPMGIDSAPFWANLFLYFYEEELISSLIPPDKTKARQFHLTNHFINETYAPTLWMIVKILEGFFVKILEVFLSP